MAEPEYTNLPVGVRESASGDTYEIGVTFNGAFIVFGVAKKGGVDEDVAEAKQQADEAAKAAPASEQTQTQ